MSAFKIFSRFADLLDIRVTRAAAAWLRLNEDGTVSERTAAQTLADLGEFCVVRSTDSEERTTTTRTADDVLVLSEAVIAGGLYQYDAAPKYTSTVAGIGFSIITPGHDNWNNAAGIQLAGSGAISNIYTAGSGISLTANAEVNPRTGSGALLRGIFLATASGSLSLAWGTSASGGGQTAKLLAGSALYLKRIA